MTRRVGFCTAPFDRTFLVLSRSWLADPELARLTRTPPLEVDAQEAWFASLATRRDYAVWGLLASNSPVGAFGLKHITGKDAEFFGYIAERRYWGAGGGGFMLGYAIEHARCRGIESVYLHVGLENQRARLLYERSGFVQVSEHDGLSRMELPLGQA